MEDPDICQHHKDHVDVWTMMDNKWSKHSNITAQITDIWCYGKPIQTLQNGEILIQGGLMGEVGTGLMAYDPALERFRAWSSEDIRTEVFRNQFEFRRIVVKLVIQQHFGVAEAGTSAGKDAVSLVAEKIGDWLNPKEIGDRHLGFWEGKLCLLCTVRTKDPDICTYQKDHIDVWTMMDNKWSKQLKITANMTDMCYISPIQTLQNGEILFTGETKGEPGVGLISYDPNRDRVRALKIHGFPEWSDEHTYIETLVVLNSGTYVGQQQREQADNND
ncbi:hypothetical protein C5167_011679 [Papaver somniferum]|uniref:F-box associated domain-containing protein n=1 Tax=Papaver somniferum TaxID=3469 RepID=A0A4Y7K7U9_PAPSO|nr:hypothetical protein C5167_011679 [Papaver somniferum]